MLVSGAGLGVKVRIRELFGPEDRSDKNDGGAGDAGISDGVGKIGKSAAEDLLLRTGSECDDGGWAVLAVKRKEFCDDAVGVVGSEVNRQGSAGASEVLEGLP